MSRCRSEATSWSASTRPPVSHASAPTAPPPKRMSAVTRMRPASTNRKEDVSFRAIASCVASGETVHGGTLQHAVPPCLSAHPPEPTGIPFPGSGRRISESTRTSCSFGTFVT